MFNEPPQLSAAAELCALLAGAVAYLAWVLGLCWPARGEPPYPVLRAVWQEGTWPSLYSLMLLIALGALWLSREYRSRG